MYGLQMFSVALFAQSHPLLGGIVFAIVLNFKHIYMYQAPPYFIFLLATYCFTPLHNKLTSNPHDKVTVNSNDKLTFNPHDKLTFNPLQLAKIGLATLSVFAISLGPFISHLPQIASRLFPFKRGLCHGTFELTKHTGRQTSGPSIHSWTESHLKSLRGF